MSGFGFDDNDDIKIKGNTDDTLVGNVGDRLKVDAQIQPGNAAPTAWASNLRYEDMNVSNGGIAREDTVGETYTNLYNKSGSGTLAGFRLTMENMWDDWKIKLIIDDNTIFDLSTCDLEGGNLYGYDRGGEDGASPQLGIIIYGNMLSWQGPLGNAMTYTSSIQIQAKYNKAGSKKFKAGLVTRTV